MNFPLKVRQWSREDGRTAKSWALYKDKNAKLFAVFSCSRKSPSKKSVFFPDYEVQENANDSCKSDSGKREREFASDFELEQAAADSERQNN